MLGVIRSVLPVTPDILYFEIFLISVKHFPSLLLIFSMTLLVLFGWALGICPLLKLDHLSMINQEKHLMLFPLSFPKQYICTIVLLTSRKNATLMKSNNPDSFNQTVFAFQCSLFTFILGNVSKKQYNKIRGQALPQSTLAAMGASMVEMNNQRFLCTLLQYHLY